MSAMQGIKLYVMDSEANLYFLQYLSVYNESLTFLRSLPSLHWGCLLSLNVMWVVLVAHVAQTRG